jgi:hypothetical protein
VQCFLKADLAVGVVYAWSVDIDEEDLPTGEFRASNIQGEVYKTLVCHNFLGNSSASLIRRACLDKVGGYSCKLKEQNAQGCEDWELYLRLAEHYQFRVAPEFLIGYRKILSSMSRDYTTMAKSHSLMLQTVREKHPELPSALYRFSSSSFYMYLARQSSQYSSPKKTFFWLYEALRVDFISTLFHFGLYVLSIQSFLRLIAEWLESLIEPAHPFFMRFKRCSELNQRGMMNTNLHKRPTQLRFKLLVESLFHRSISMI